MAEPMHLILDHKARRIGALGGELPFDTAGLSAGQITPAAVFDPA